MKRYISIVSGAAIMALASTAQAEIKNPDTLVFLWNSNISSLDPAYIGDTPSTYASLNVYSRLLDYDGSNISSFVPALSSAVPSVGNGLIEELDGGAVIPAAFNIDRYGPIFAFRLM